MVYFGFAAEQKRRAAKLRKLRQTRIRAESRAKLSKLEQKELKRINLARAATKSRSPGLVAWGRKALKSKEAKRIRKELGV